MYTLELNVPSGYHRDDITAAREIGQKMYGYIYIYISDRFLTLIESPHHPPEFWNG